MSRILVSSGAALLTLMLVGGCDQPLPVDDHGDIAARGLVGADQPRSKPDVTHCRPNPCGEGQVQDAASGCCVPEPAGPVCGDTQCASYEECCNASCGICVMPDENCTQEVCDPVE